MKIFKKRLPVLILAFLIAVMPLAMAVPVNADVLSSSDAVPSGYIFKGPDGDVSYPLVYKDGVEPASAGYIVFVLYESNNYRYRYYVIYNDAVTSISISGSKLYIRVSGNYLYSFVSYTSSLNSWASSFDGPFSGNVGETKITLSFDPSYTIYVANVDPSLYSDYSSSIQPLSYVYTSTEGPGVFTVFSGVSSWLAGAVNNMIPMFWTAEAGLTPIGVLAVCSLALTVILLLFWLIAGWLKFK